MSGDVTRRFLISGRVQGVFFRDWTVATAQAIGIGGWVRNLADGRVEIVATASAADLDSFEAHCSEGPPRSWVDAIAREDLPPEPFSGFTKRADG